MVDVPRPAPPRSVAERIRDQIEFVGVARLLSAAVAVVAVVGGAWFLVADAGPPPEADLPRAVPAAGSGSIDDSTAETGTETETETGTGIGTAQVVVSTDGEPATERAVEPAGSVDAVRLDEPVVVHVAGAVLSPGVHDLRRGDRIADAVARAGGPAEGADLDALNLAAPLVDGARIVVPTEGEQAVVEFPSGLPVSDAGVLDPSTAPAGDPGPIDINRAGVVELDALPGVGPTTAAAIVTERERNGPFSSIDDLERVPGIGPAKLAVIRDQVTT